MDQDEIVKELTRSISKNWERIGRRWQNESRYILTIEGKLNPIDTLPSLSYILPLGEKFIHVFQIPGTLIATVADLNSKYTIQWPIIDGELAIPIVEVNYDAKHPYKA